MASKNKMTQILQSPDKGISRTPGVNGILSHMFRKIMLDTGLTPMRWGTFMAAFINDVRNGVPRNKRDQTSIRGNLTKEFARPQMTWKVFIKAMRFLQITNIKITIEATHRDREYPSVHTVNVPLGGIPLEQVLEETHEPEIEGESEMEDENAELFEQIHDQLAVDTSPPPVLV